MEQRMTWLTDLLLTDETVYAEAQLKECKLAKV
jgi:hypothetical protein